jgi:hypothetical protein
MSAEPPLLSHQLSVETRLLSSALALLASAAPSLFACSATMDVTPLGHDDGESFT